MAIYDWRTFEEADEFENAGLPHLTGRFPARNDIVGVREWRRLIAEILDRLGQAETVDGAAAIDRAFDRFVEAVTKLTRPPGPARVFVSHQRGDSTKAERIAWHATEVGFEYWLDIHDRALAAAQWTALPLHVRAVLIAAIIEMGLLNSTHIVAVQTQKAQRSHWVPYEFGRAKQRSAVSLAAASWFERGVAPDPNGDYLSLAFCAMTEQELSAWLSIQPGAGPVKPNTLWTRPVPQSLPN